MKSLIVFVAAAFAAACGGSTPTTPASPNPVSSVSGTWTGTAADSTGTVMGGNYTSLPGIGMMGGPGMMQGTMGQMTWQITQTGNQFSGVMSFSGMHGQGRQMNVSGTIDEDGDIDCHLEMPVGSMLLPSCSATAEGHGQFHDGMMTGTYDGTNSCLGPFGSGQFTLRRQ